MSEQAADYDFGSGLAPNDRVRVPSHPEFGIGEVLRVAETAGFYQADVVFDTTSIPSAEI